MRFITQADPKSSLDRTDSTFPVFSPHLVSRNHLVWSRRIWRFYRVAMGRCQTDSVALENALVYD